MELLEGTYKLSSNFHDKEFKMLDRLIQKADKIVIFYHNGIDADAKGSTVAMMMGIQEKYHKDVEIAKQGSHYELTSKDLVILLDVGDIFRLAGSFSGNPIISRIDHHPTSFICPVNIQDISAGSTSELVTLFLTNYNYPISSRAAELLFQGIIADTGRLQYNISDTALIALSILKSQNVDYKSIYNKMYVKDSDDLKVRNYILNNYKLSKNGLVYLFLDRERSLDAEIDMNRAGSHLHELSNIKGCPIWVLITDIGQNKITMRIRSRSIPINNIAEKYGGGGHENAAAIRVKNKQQAKEILAELDKYIYDQRISGVLKEEIDFIELYDNSTDDINSELNESSFESRIYKRRMKIIMKSIKYLPDEALNKALPEMANKNHYAKVKAIRYRISTLPKDKLYKIINSPAMIQLEENLRKSKKLILGISGSAAGGSTTGAIAASGVTIATAAAEHAALSSLSSGIGLALSIVAGGIFSVAVTSLSVLGFTTAGIIYSTKSKNKVKKAIPDIMDILKHENVLSESEDLYIKYFENIIDVMDESVIDFAFEIISPIIDCDDNMDLTESTYNLESSFKIKETNNKNGIGIEFFKNNIKIGKASICDDYYGEKLSFLHDLEIEKDYRSKGYGTKLMEYLINKYNIKYLNVAEDNNVARNLYEKFGFKKTEKVKMDNNTIMDRMERNTSLKESLKTSKLYDGNNLNIKINAEIDDENQTIKKGSTELKIDKDDDKLNIEVDVESNITKENNKNITYYNKKLEKDIANANRIGIPENPSDIIASAVKELAEKHIGGLITFEKNKSLDEYTTNGKELNCPISRDIFMSILYPGTNLHDGAIIIKNNIIKLANVFYQNIGDDDLKSEYGARHRSALSISKLTDAVSIVISEETGKISFAVNGELLLTHPNKVKENIDKYIYNTNIKEDISDIEDKVLHTLLEDNIIESQETKLIRRRMKLLLKSVKYVPNDVLDKTFPELKGKSYYSKVKALRYRISNLDKTKLAKLLSHPALLQLEQSLLKTKHLIQGASRKFKDDFDDQSKSNAGIALGWGIASLTMGSTTAAAVAGASSPVVAASMGFALASVFAGLVTCGLAAIGAVGAATAGIIVNKKNKNKIKESIPDIVRILQDDEILSEMNIDMLISLLEQMIISINDDVLDDVVLTESTRYKYKKLLKMPKDKREKLISEDPSYKQAWDRWKDTDKSANIAHGEAINAAIHSKAAKFAGEERDEYIKEKKFYKAKQTKKLQEKHYEQKDNSIKHAINISKNADRYSVDTKPDDETPGMNSITFTHQGRENGDTAQITLHAKTDTIKEINDGDDTIKGQVFIKKSNNKNRSVNNQAVHNITGKTLPMKAGDATKKLKKQLKKKSK